MPQLQAAGRRHQQRRGDMQRAVKARRAEDDLVWPRLRIAYEFLQRVPRLLVVDDQYAGIGNKSRQRNEIGIGELRLPTEQPIDLGKAGNRGEVGQESIAVRLGMRGDL